ncbi:MAG: hypothetical protein KAT32_05055 [Candidatus Moranbacteria bacterium]|nr:hypothetical protein [Candidatus Moranbacteria bacterium]
MLNKFVKSILIILNSLEKISKKVNITKFLFLFFFGISSFFSQKTDFLTFSISFVFLLYLSFLFSVKNNPEKELNNKKSDKINKKLKSLIVKDFINNNWFISIVSGLIVYFLIRFINFIFS